MREVLFLRKENSVPIGTYKGFRSNLIFLATQCDVYFAASCKMQQSI